MAFFILFFEKNKTIKAIKKDKIYCFEKEFSF